MKKSIVITISSLLVLFVAGVAVFWFRSGPATTSIELSGVAGSQFTGCYVRDGQRVDISGVLPWSFHGIGISEFEFRKVHPADSFTLMAQYTEPGEAAQHVIIVPSGKIGLRDRFHDHGMSTERL